MGEEPPTIKLEYRTATPVVPTHRQWRTGTAISTINAFLGVALVPLGFLYVADLPQQGAAMMAAGVLLVTATLKYISTDQPKYFRSFIASGLALILLGVVAVQAWNQVGSLSDRQLRQFAQVQGARKLASRTDVARFSFVRDAATVAAGINLLLCAWILVRILKDEDREITETAPAPK